MNNHLPAAKALRWQEETDKARRQEQYIRDVSERFDRVLAVTGYRPGGLARLFSRALVGIAKHIGASRDETTKLLHEEWELVEGSSQIPEDL
jgi:hypothetical protein